MKITALILLIVGLGIGGFGAYGYFLSGDYDQCRRADAAAEEKLNAARAAHGTSEEAALIKEARMEADSQEFWCRNAKRTEQWTALTGLGGVVAIVIAGGVLGFARKPGN